MSKSCYTCGSQVCNCTIKSTEKECEDTVNNISTKYDVCLHGLKGFICREECKCFECCLCSKSVRKRLEDHYKAEGKTRQEKENFTDIKTHSVKNS